jgi:hypothetical protein
VEPYGNYFLRYRFRLLKKSGSGSNFCQVTVPVPYLDRKKQFSNKCLEKILPFYILSFFRRKKLIRRKSNTGTQFSTVFVRTFVTTFYYWAETVINYGSGSNFLTSYGSGSTRQKVTVPTVQVPQKWLGFPSPSLMRRVRVSSRLAGLGGSASQVRPVS